MIRRQLARITLLVLTLLCTAFNVQVFASESLRIAVVEFDTMGNLEIPDAGRIIAEWMVTNLTKEGKFDLKAREVLLKKVIQEQALSASGLIDNKTALEIGKVYGVEAIVTGSVTKWGKTVTVEARLIDAQNGSILKADSVKAENTDDIPQKIQTLAATLSSVNSSGITKQEIDTHKLSIKSVNGYGLLGIHFFEKPYGEAPPRNMREYKTKFEGQSTRYIDTEIFYSNPNYKKEDGTFNLVYEYLYPDGTRMCLRKLQAEPKAIWENAYYCAGWGNRELGQAWTQIGEYTVNVYFEETLVGTSKFSIY